MKKYSEYLFCFLSWLAEHLDNSIPNAWAKGVACVNDAIRQDIRNDKRIRKCFHHVLNLKWIDAFEFSNLEQSSSSLCSNYQSGRAESDKTDHVMKAIPFLRRVGGWLRTKQRWEGGWGRGKRGGRGGGRVSERRKKERKRGNNNPTKRWPSKSRPSTRRHWSWHSSPVWQFLSKSRLRASVLWMVLLSREHRWNGGRSCLIEIVH